VVKRYVPERIQELPDIKILEKPEVDISAVLLK
jgi:hypothetical protein